MFILTYAASAFVAFVYAAVFGYGATGLGEGTGIFQADKSRVDYEARTRTITITRI
ncbi:hypothetical protein [Candidatus Desulforudis audaxviator]|uniref:hypothetical protein n=1 Tax=Candidatus Desulforudis audaxviator TaxID=471827 RepID=UPI00140FD4A0|nr:hypothetical protein [Candidatus Desulforudis audaxviator]